MAIKNVEFDVNLQSPKKQYSFERLVVFTNDKLSVNLVFNILDMTSVELTGKTAEVLLYMADGSFFQSTSVSVSGTKFSYILKPNEAKHAGLTKVQLVVKDGTKDVASSLFEFRIENGLEEKVVQEVIVRDWETITTEARAFIAEMKENEDARKSAFTTSQSQRKTVFDNAQTKRETDFTSAQTLRKRDYDSFKTTIESSETQRAENETGRVSAENIRKETFTANELERKETFEGKESDRQVEFEASEAGRTTTFDNNEAIRESGYNDQLNLLTEKVEAAIVEPEVEKQFDGLEEKYATKLTNVNAQLAQKANDEDVSLKLNLKRDKSVPITENDISNTLAEAMTNGATINVESIPRDYSVTPGKTNFFVLSRNLFDKNEVTNGRINEVTGEIYIYDNYFTSDYIKVTPGREYTFTKAFSHVYFDEKLSVIKGNKVNGVNSYTSIAPDASSYIRFELHKTASPIDNYMFVEGSELPDDYEVFGADYIPTEKIEDPTELSRRNFDEVFLLGNDLQSGINLNALTSEGNFTGIANGNYKNLPADFDSKFSFLVENRALFKNQGRWCLQTITMNGGEYNSWMRRVDSQGAGTTDWVSLSIKQSNDSDTLFGKKIAMFGDSITEFGNYPEIAAKKNGVILSKFGFGGTRLAHHTDAYYDAFSFAKLADAIVSSDFTLQQNKIDDLKNPFSPRFKTAFNSLKITNFSNIDCITIFYGTNDYMGTAAGTVPIGSPNDKTRETFYGALNYSIEKLLTAYPNLKILFLTPTWRENHTSLTTGEVDTTPNTSGTYLVEFVDAIIDRAEVNHLPYLDLFRTSGINKFNKSIYLADFVHYTPFGYEYIGNKIGSWLNSIY